MLTSLYSAVSGLQQFQTGLDVIGNNVANANTVGFKSARTEYKDGCSQDMVASGGTGDSAPGVMQVGTGSRTAAITNLFSQGSMTSTGLASDLAINGEGFFIVRDTASGEEFATRAGNFKVDTNGYIVTNEGRRLQGFSDAGLTTRGDLKIDGLGRPATSDPTAPVDDFAIDAQGKIRVSLTDGSSFVRGQVLLQNFSNPQALVKQGSNLYSGVLSAGPLGGSTPRADVPGSSGLGEIEPGALEMSNVDLTNEFAGLITTQRAFQANARVLTTTDEILQEVVNLKR